MSQPLRKNNFVPGSLRGPRTARTLLLRMAADQDRADRIRDTWLARKADDPKRYTWRRIAEHVNNVSERAAQDWQKTGGIEYDNAKKLAEYFEVDFDWLWRGPKEEAKTPDPFARETQVDDGFEEFRAHVGEIRTDIAELKLMLEQARSEREAIRELLATQETILNEMRRVAGRFPDDDSIEHLTATMRDLADRAEADAAARGEDASTQADTRRQTR